MQGLTEQDLKKDGQACSKKGKRFKETMGCIYVRPDKKNRKVSDNRLCLATQGQLYIFIIDFEEICMFVNLSGGSIGFA